MSNFVHLHNHSDYSLLDGAVKIPWYVAEAKKYGMKHVGLTDHGNLFGALRFEQACHAADLNPIVGCEVYVAPGSRFVKPSTGVRNYHMVLYCKNEKGYHNLTNLVSRGYTEGFYYKPRIDDELLEQYHEGLICSTACLGGEIPQNILKGDMDKAREKALYYRDLFGEENFYLEIMDHGMEEEKKVIQGILQLNKETGIPIIATNDIHYRHKEHANAQDILICIGTNKKKSDSGRLTMSPELYFKSPQQMEELFSYCPEALENTVKLAEKCDLTIPQPGPILPDYFIPEDFEDKQQYLQHLVFEGLKNRYDEITKEIEDRALFELKTIEEMGFPGYFLIVWDFIDWARKKDIPVGPGRGSGAGSIVAYALGITDIEPLQYGLLFERFLNPERVSMPDFDVDFCFERRQEVIDYVTRKYGYDQVGGICTFGTLKTKAVLKDVARVLDIPFDESNAITKLVPDDKPPKDWDKSKIEFYLEQDADLRSYMERGGVYKELFETAAVLEGMNRHISTHACGKVIGNSQLTDYCPLYKDQKTGEITTEFTMDIIEPCGLVKMDFLGLKTLTLLKNTEKLIRKKHPDFSVDDIPEDDQPTFDMLCRGESTAVFQFESPGMQKILRDARPSNVEDLIALNALYRPGPMQFIPQFVAGKHDPKTIKYPDPTLKELLEPTYGVIVYQEQVMKVAQIIGGFSLGKADILRRAMGKKKVKDMEKMKVEFVAGAEKKGHDAKHATYIFEMLEPFAGYGFNKSHAAAYSIVAYKTAFCKANYPAEFMAANLTNENGNPDAFKMYLDATRDMGLEIMPPDINISEKEFSVEHGKIYYGLMGIKGMGSAVVDAIIRERDANGHFQSFEDFLNRVDAVNKKTLEVSIQTGLFDKIETQNRATLFHNMERLLEIANKTREGKKYGQSSLFGDCEDEIAPEVEYEEVPEWSSRDILQFEKDHLGFYFSGHPMDDYRKIWKKRANLDLEQIQRASESKEYNLLGMIKDFRTLITKKGRKMAFATLEDFNGQIGLTMFSKSYEEFGHLLEADKIIGVVGTVDFSRDTPGFKVKRIVEPEALEEKNVREVHIELNEIVSDEDELIEFRTYLARFNGSCGLYIHISRGNDYIVIKATSQLNLNSTEETLQELSGHPLVRKIWKE